MAPEYNGFGEISPRIDTYSFGIVLLELLTGLPANHVEIARDQHGGLQRALNEPRELHKVLRRIRAGNAEVRHLSEEWTDEAAEELAQIAFKCLEYYPKKRATMKAVQDALGNLERAADAASREF